MWEAPRGTTEDAVKKLFPRSFRSFISMDHKDKVSYSNNQSLVRFYGKLDLNRLFIFWSPMIHSVCPPA